MAVGGDEGEEAVCGFGLGDVLRDAFAATVERDAACGSTDVAVVGIAHFRHKSREYSCLLPSAVSRRLSTGSSYVAARAVAGIVGWKPVWPDGGH